MEIDDLRVIWRREQQMYKQQKVLNQRLILQLIKDKSKWLAPITAIQIIIFSLCGLITIAAIVFNQMYEVSPIILISIYGFYQLCWQHKYRKKIENIDGGIVGMEYNIIEYKKKYIKTKKYTIIILIPYMLWLSWFMYHLGWGYEQIILLILFTTILCIIAFLIRNRRTFTAIEDIEKNLRELSELEN